MVGSTPRFEVQMASLGHVMVIGGGIAGASAAYFLVEKGAFSRVTLLEAEPQLGLHTTGRSAALLTENYGPLPVRPLTTASVDFLTNPPDELAADAILSQRGRMTVASVPQAHHILEAQLAESQNAATPACEIDLDQARELAPHIRYSDEHRVLWDARASDIDVAGLHQIFVRGLRSLGGQIATSHRVDAARQTHDGWVVDTTGGPLRGDVIVNAAGAWGDIVAQAAGVAPIGLQPMRRTAFMVASPFEDSSSYPFVVDAQHRWYLRPDGPQFMCSPADETPSEPCDARPEELDIARAIDLINENTTLGIRSVRSKWAGLRTFAPDRSFVIGPEPTQPNFVWFVGQGGTGIQAAPAAGQLLADLVVDGVPRASLANIDLAGLTPERLRG